MQKMIKALPFIPIVCLIISIIIGIKMSNTDYTTVDPNSTANDICGVLLCLPLCGIPIGIIGLAKGENKVLSIINIIIGSSIFILPLIFTLMIITIMGFSSI